MKFEILSRRARLAAAGAVAAFALGGAGVVLAANATPSPRASQPTVAATPHPADSPEAGDSSSSGFGSQVEAQVAKCKAARPTSGGHQGIGQCVSAWVVAHNPGHTGSHGAPSNTSGASH